MFHRQDMHKMLMEAALGEGEGIRPELKLDHKLTDIDFETGRIKFENGTEVQHDAVVAADGVGVRNHWGRSTTFLQKIQVLWLTESDL